MYIPTLTPTMLCSPTHLAKPEPWRRSTTHLATAPEPALSTFPVLRLRPPSHQHPILSLLEHSLQNANSLRCSTYGNPSSKTPCLSLISLLP